jgi:glycosyltransferase involved in cell wall biosynthesis
MNIREHNSKILFIITDLGGFNNFLAELCEFLIQKNKFEISVICSETKIIDYEDKFDFTSVGIRFYFVDIPRGYNILKQIAASRIINRIISEEKPDIIHAHFTTAIFTTLLCKRKNTRIWGTFHGLGYVVSIGSRKIIFKLIEYFCFSRLKKIIVLNEMDYKIIPVKYRKRLIKSIGLGCDLQKFDNNRFSISEKMILKQELEINKQFILAFTGRFVYFKGFHIIAKTFLELSKKYNFTFKLILIGGKDPIHISGLTDEEEKVFFDHPDVIEIGFTKDVNKYLSIVDLFVFPSKKEGIPISITEALTMGIPVITFNSRGCNELVKDGFNGILIKESPNVFEEVNLFINAVEKLFLDQNLYDLLKRNAINSRDKLSREHFINEQTEWYLENLNL